MSATLHIVPDKKEAIKIAVLGITSHVAPSNFSAQKIPNIRNVLHNNLRALHSIISIAQYFAKPQALAKLIHHQRAVAFSP
jgi:hypothetical protein